MTNDSQNAVAGWYKDPSGEYEFRFWDGAQWTEHVQSRDSRVAEPLDNRSQPALGESGSSATSAPGGIAPAEPRLSTPIRQPNKVPLFGTRKLAQSLEHENERLQRLITDHGLGDIASLDLVADGLRRTIADRESEILRANSALESAIAQRELVEQDVVNLREIASLQEFGLFDYEHPAEDSVALMTELESLRQQIKDAIRDGRATQATENFTFNNSASKGRKFVSDMSKLLLRAYNAEAENAVKAVRVGNLASAQKRLITVADQIARLGNMINLSITPQYHRLRLKELELANRHLQALQAEKELERARREELREQKRVEQELSAERERLEKERSHYANVLSALEDKGDAEGAERVRERLADVERAIENVDYRVANVRAGYVYVISNIGAFGSDVVKIGMTRRLEPMDRINELGDASVPFRFDVHALFFANDAVSIEATLHREFSNRRLNKVNLRREYFHATPVEVLEVLRAHAVEVLEYAIDAEAPEYRMSLTLTN